MSGKKRILVIGAGCSGLAAIKACLEDDLIPVCLEKTLDIGGLWNYSPDPSAPGTAGIYDSLVINTSKETMGFSDFPIPTHYPQFLPHAHVLSYFRLYANHFSLLPHIRFNTEVRHVRQADDYDTTGRWSVTYVKHAHKTCPMKCANVEGCQEKVESNRNKEERVNAEGFQEKVESPSKKGECADTDEGVQEKIGDGSKKENLNGKTDIKSYELKFNQNGTRNNDKTNGITNGQNLKEMDLHKEANHKEVTDQNGTMDKTSENDQQQAMNGKDQLENIKAMADTINGRSNHKQPDNGSETQILKNHVENGHEFPRREFKENGYEIHDKNTMPKTNGQGTHFKDPKEPVPIKYKMADSSQEPDVTYSEGCQEVREEFDGVMVCTGHHTVPYMPSFTGQERFQGRILHSQDYKRPESFKGQRVLVIGIGNSAVDIASDLAKTAKQVHLSTRRGAWVISRSMWGLPADLLANSRVMFSLPQSLLQVLVERQANLRMDHDQLGLTPKHRSLGAHPTINDELPFHLLTRRVQIRCDVSKILDDAVEFSDGTVQHVDVIIMATGYDYRLDFVDPQVLKVIDNRVTLYKYMFPPHLSHGTLAVIGLVQAIGAVMPISELQTRWFASLMTGRVQLADRETMERDIERKKNEMDSRYYTSRRHTLQAFWIEYMDEIASQIGARPDLWRLLLTQPTLTLRCFLGPCLPAQYRLQGPHPWPHAQQYIRSLWTRCAFRPKTTRDPKRQPQLPQAVSADTQDDVPASENPQHPRHDKGNTAMMPKTHAFTVTSEGHMTSVADLAVSEKCDVAGVGWKGMMLSFYTLVVALCLMLWLGGGV